MMYLVGLSVGRELNIGVQVKQVTSCEMRKKQPDATANGPRRFMSKI